MAFFSLFGILLIGLSLRYQGKKLLPRENMNQIAKDWQTVPYVDLMVTSAETCPGDTEVALWKPWLGTDVFCICQTNTHWEHRRGLCSEGKTFFNLNSLHCVELPALSPVIQGQFNGVRVCGTRGGQSFTQSTRVGPNDLCPEGTRPCGPHMSPENTICYPQDDLASSCPITDIDVISNPSELKEYQRKGYSVLALGQGKSLVFSKHVADSLPITTIRIENEPCFVDSQPSSAPGTVMLKNEIMKTESCQADKNSAIVTDERFKETSAWSINEADILKENGVYDRLFSQEPKSIGDFMGPDAKTMEFIQEDLHLMRSSLSTRADNEQKLWLRPTIMWKLECEYEDKVSRHEAFKIFNMSFNMLSFVDDFKFLGFFIIALTVSPMIIYTVGRESMQRYRYLQVVPYAIRLLFIWMFYRMTSITGCKLDECQKVRKDSQMFVEINNCVDAYSQVDIDQLDDDLGWAEGKLMFLWLAFWFACLLSVAELTFLIYELVKKNRS